MSVFGPSSLGRPPNLDRMSYQGSGHVGIRNLPEPGENQGFLGNRVLGSRYSAREVLGQGVQGLPETRTGLSSLEIKKLVPFQEKTQGPFVIPDGSGIYDKEPIKHRDRDLDKDFRRVETKVPVIIYKGPSCGGSSCNLYKKSMSNSNYVSDPTESCTCCSEGKKCRNSKLAPNMIKYDDCCPGSECFTEFDTDEYGHCSRKRK
jgi:hypothetical protein